MLTLKKYANGRLYDTVNKKYVTKDQLAELIENKEKVKVVLAKTGKDVTRSVVASLSASTSQKKNGNSRLLSKKAALETRLDDTTKWIGKQFDKGMDTILEALNFPNKRQVVKLNADVNKLAKKVDVLQKQHAEAQKKMKLEHRKEMQILAQRYDERIRKSNPTPAARNA